MVYAMKEDDWEVCVCTFSRQITFKLFGGGGWQLEGSTYVPSWKEAIYMLYVCKKIIHNRSRVAHFSAKL